MRLPFLFQVVLQQAQFLLVAGGIQIPAHQLETQVHQPGVEYIGFAVIANALDVTVLEGIKHLGATHAHLAGKTQQSGDLVQRCIGAAIVHGQHIHQVQMTLVVTAQVVVPLEAGILVTGIPVTAGLHAMLEGTVMQHRQVKPPAIPAHQVRREALDAIVETLDQLFLGAVLVAQ